MTILSIVRRAMLRALQWRLLLVSSIVLMVAAAATLVPLARVFGELFDYSPSWQGLTSLDSYQLAGVTKALLGPAAAGIATGVQTSLLLAIVFAPLLAGAALSVATSDTRTTLRGLLSGAAGSYPRLVRMQLVALVPLGAAAGLAAVAFAWASGVDERATSEAATHTSARIAWLVTVIVVVLGQLVVDAGRARLVAEPARRSAVVALGAGVKLIVKRPKQTLVLAVSSMVPALVAAALVLVIRQQITQASIVAVLVAFLLTQLAVASIAWGHAVKLCGLVEIARELGASASPALATASALPASPAAPADPAPVVATPADPAPVVAAPVDPAPVVATPADPAPVVATPADPAPVVAAPDR